MEKLNSGRMGQREEYKCCIYAYKGTLHQSVGHSVSEKGFLEKRFKLVWVPKSKL